jgi:hypothetical protein
VDWSHLAQDRDQWQALVNKAQYLKLSEITREFLDSLKAVASLRLIHIFKYYHIWVAQAI